MVINKYLSISSNVNVLNVPIKRHSVAELIMKHILPTRDPHQNKRPMQTESEGLEKIFQTNRQKKKSQDNNTYI